MTNEEIAQILENIAELLEILGENSFKVRAYQKAAASIRLLENPVRELVEKGNLDDIPWVGKSISETVKEIVTTGKSTVYEKLVSKIPASVAQLTKVPGIGPKTAKLLYENLGVIDIEGLKRVVEDGSIKKVKGIGVKTREVLEKSLFLKEEEKTKNLLPEAEVIAERLVTMLKNLPLVEKVHVAGSLRRMTDTVESIDLVIQSKNPEKALEDFVRTYQIGDLILKDDNQIVFNFEGSFKVNLLVVRPENAGAALIVHTGSKEHVERLKELAQKKGLKLSSEGLTDVKSGKDISCSTEKDIYKKLGLEYIPPFLRENRGEIEAAQEQRLPDLVRMEDIKADLHIHSIWSDSSATVEEIAEVCIALGYQYIAITDHAKRLKVAGGIEEEEIYERINAIRKQNDKFKNKLKILCGIELNIDKDGLLDYTDEILKSFDFVIASIHWGFPSEEEKITRRIIKAMENPYVHALGHPTGRLLLRRPPYIFNKEEVFRIASETNTAIEINAYPDRLDLTAELCREAWEKYGIKFCIGTDAHALKHLPYIRYGVGVAKRAWLPSEAILNTYPPEEFLELIKK